VSIDGERPPCRQKIYHELIAPPSGCPTHLVIDQSGQWQVIEEICEELPDVGISILSQTLVVESVNLGDLTTLVVSSQNGYSVSISKLESNEQGNRFDGVVSSINVVSHEEVIRIGRVTADSEEFRQIVLNVSHIVERYIHMKSSRGTYELTVNITTYSDGTSDWLDV